MPNVRDLLIRMSLDTATFKKNIADAKGELQTLKSEFKAVSSDSNVENAGGKLLENLREQKSTAEALVKEYEKGLREVRTKLNEVPAGSQAASQLQQQVTKLETGLNNAKTSVNEIQTKIDTFRLENLTSAAEKVAGIFSSLRLGFGELLDGFGETADSADQVFVSRQAAFVSATKNVEDERQTREDLDALNKSLREMSTQIPQTYEQLSALMGVGATLGVPYESLLKFTEVMAKLNTATNVDGEGGAQAMAQFLNITEKGYGNLDRLGAALTDLGNNSATTEQNILEMAHRAATGLSTVGMSAQDILALSAAINSVGIEAQAGGSSVSKLGITMDKAAKVGADAGGKLLAAWGDDEIKSVYDLYAALDQLGSANGWRVMAENLGMNMADTKALMDSALAVERFSQAMGQTKEEFAAAWNADAATQMLNFFRALGSMEGTDESENMLWVMDQLGIKEIRQSNMVRALAGNWELYANMLGIARNAYDENIALENEAQRAFSTTESQRIINQNKEQNALEAMGQTVTAMRTPWESFFADLKQWFTEWPDWAQAGISAGTEALGKAGELLDALGKFSFNLMNIATAIKEIEKTTIGARILKTLGAAGSAAAAALPVAGLAGGTIALGVKLDEISTEKNWGEYNRVQEQLPQLMAEVADEKTARMQAILDSFSQAMKDTENIEPGEDRLGPVKDMFRRYANELLQEMPDLKFWDTASFYADLADGLDEAEIEKIIQGMEFADQWYDLGNEAVTSLAKAIEDRKAELAQSALDMGLQVDAGLAQGIYDGADQVLEAASWLAGQVEEQMRVDLDVHSPSRKMEVLGGYVAQGFARGIENGLARIEGAADRMVHVMERSSSGASRAMPAAGNGRGGAAFIINIDGKAFAQAIAPYVDDALGEAAWP